MTIEKIQQIIHELDEEGQIPEISNDDHEDLKTLLRLSFRKLENLQKGREILPGLKPLRGLKLLDSRDLLTEKARENCSRNVKFFGPDNYLDRPLGRSKLTLVQN